MGTTIAIVAAVAFLAALIAVRSSVHIAREYERGVVFRLGRLINLKGPGLFLIIPFGFDRLIKIDLRVVTLVVPPQEVITNDNVTVKVNAVIFFQVLDARSAVTQVFDYVNATSQKAQTTLRAVLGQHSLDELLAKRESINQSLQQIIDQQTEPWGIRVSSVEVKDVELPQAMQRAIARQAEAEREKRAKIIAAEGEFQAAQNLADAAKVISTQPAALALRYMQTLLDMGTDKTSTVVFPLPVELIKPLLDSFGQNGASNAVLDARMSPASRRACRHPRAELPGSAAPGWDTLVARSWPHRSHRALESGPASEAWVSPDRLPVAGKLLEETIESAQDNGFLEALAAVCISGQPQHLRSFSIPSLNSGNGSHAGESLWDLEAYALKDAEGNVAFVLVCAVEARRSERPALEVVAGRQSPQPPR